MKDIVVIRCKYKQKSARIPLHLAKEVEKRLALEQKSFTDVVKELLVKWIDGHIELTNKNI